MTMITVSHAAFTCGSEIAQKVASNLNYRCVNREVLMEASQRYGIPEPATLSHHVAGRHV
jgi:hypothetical protein